MAFFCRIQRSHCTSLSRRNYCRQSSKFNFSLSISAIHSNAPLGFTPNINARMWSVVLWGWAAIAPEIKTKNMKLSRHHHSHITSAHRPPQPPKIAYFTLATSLKSSKFSSPKFSRPKTPKLGQFRISDVSAPRDGRECYRATRVSRPPQANHGRSFGHEPISNASESLSQLLFGFHSF